MGNNQGCVCTNLSLERVPLQGRHPLCGLTGLPLGLEVNMWPSIVLRLPVCVEEWASLFSDEEQRGDYFLEH